MSYYLNKITDLIKNKVYVDNGPLEELGRAKSNSSNEININKINKIPILKQDSFNEDIISEPTVNNTYHKSNSVLNENFTVLDFIPYNEIFRKEFLTQLSQERLEYESDIILRIDDYDYEVITILTNYFLIIQPIEKNLKQKMRNHFKIYSEDYFYVPIFAICKIEKSVDKKNPNKYLLDISTKDNRYFKLIIDNFSKKFYGSLANLTNPKDCSLFLDSCKKYREIHPVNNDGWNVYNLIEEFKRQGIEDLPSGFKGKFRISNINKNFELCTSYPRELIVPFNISDDELRESANFRTKARIPTLCYFNKDNNTSIWRSSQTKSGLTSQRNECDEKLLQCITEINSNGEKKTKLDKLIIFDARPYLNAFANRFKGAGFENTDYYKNTEIFFCEIDNIHCVRSAQTKLNSIITSAKLSENKSYFSNLEASTWVSFIYQIIKSSVDIAKTIKAGHSVLIHCSDGWDRSSQLTSLSQILIDPFYRTLGGFIVLIEKEWLSFGHQFGLRNGLYNPKDQSEDQRSCIFLQWLDCIHQIMVQFPHLFEFNLNLLNFLAYHQNTCLYGTFLFNSEKERDEKRANYNTVSIWTDIIENKEKFLNPFYKYDEESMLEQNVKYLIPNFSFYKIRLWEENFLRFLHFQNNFSRFYSIKSKETTNQHTDSSKSLPKTNIQTSYQFIEMEKLNDLAIIKSQKAEIDKLNKVLKEISTKLVIKVNDYNELSDKTKEIISEISNGDLIEEDGYILIKTNGISN